MVRKSLLVVSLLAIATPLAAQETYTWSSTRPDAIAPGGVRNAQILPKGKIEVAYRFVDLRYQGLWYQKDSVPLETALGLYARVPLSLSNRTHHATLALGLTDDVTLQAEIGYSYRTREQAISPDSLYVISGQELGDLRVLGLYRFYNQDGYESHVQFGALIPTGEFNMTGVIPYPTPHKEPLPYDMQSGAGTYAVLSGLTAQAQNGQGSVGGQVEGTFFMGLNSKGYRLGNRVEATGWAAVKINDSFSASMRVDWQKWGKIHGGRADLDPAADPGNYAYFLDGQRVDVPIGVNFYLPSNSRFAGQRVTLEVSAPVYHKYAGPQLGLDWGLHIGWQVVF